MRLLRKPIMPLFRGYTLNHTWNPNMIAGIFLIKGKLGFSGVQALSRSVSDPRQSAQIIVNIHV